MNQTNKVLGIAAAVLLGVGVLFKKFHWPGASLIISIGGLVFLAFFVIYLISGTKPLQAGLEKATGLTGAVTMIVTLLAFVFKIQHFMGGSVLVVISQAGLLATSIMLIVGAIRETDPPRQSIKALFAFTLFVLIAILALMTPYVGYFE
jgi:hypothetical protein